ncbi:MAG: ImmA/IrrE family metallo-endopeptidase [Planctomycetia bacterium]|nr:ImmA/IrrE family metallo-endopeptidase [Planctomycetia bacterium]
MDRIESINTKRIEWCCAERGTALEDVANAIGISDSTLQRVMDGESGLTFRQLQSLAAYFNRGILFFLEPGRVNEQKLYTPQFRTLTSQKPDLSPKVKDLIEKAEWFRHVFLHLQEELGKEWREFSPPEIDPSNIQVAAREVRRWLGLRDHNTFESYRKAVELKGILVLRSMGYAGAWQFPRESTIAGFSLYFERCPVIVVRKQEFEARQVFTLIHELGHILLHKGSFIDEDKDLFHYQGRERDANRFAGRVLVPKAFLDQINDRTRPQNVSAYDDWLWEYRDRWGVSAEVILRRLLDIGRLEEVQYEAYRKWRAQVRTPMTKGGSRQYRHREPIHIFGQSYVRSVFDALHTKRITLAKASTYLDNLKVSDLHELEAHLANS